MKKEIFSQGELSELERLEVLGGIAPGENVDINGLVTGDSCTGNSCTGNSCTGNHCTGNNCTGNECSGGTCFAGGTCHSGIIC